MLEAIHVYRETFRPSAQLDQPYVMLGYNVFAADTDAEAALLATSMMQAFVNLRTGMPTQLLPPVEGYYEAILPAQRTLIDHVLSCSAIGSPETVRQRVEAFIAETGADELMIAAMIFDHAKRLRSYELLADLIER
jgi:alkanesulfonate monooxygenase SsuD/methylene tetrahydromethanopterin reductase-like flavin-dependent oxidoreductase (luciferase family)